LRENLHRKPRRGFPRQPNAIPRPINTHSRAALRRLRIDIDDDSHCRSGRSARTRATPASAAARASSTPSARDQSNARRVRPGAGARAPVRTVTATRRRRSPPARLRLSPTTAGVITLDRIFSQGDRTAASDAAEPFELSVKDCSTCGWDAAGWHAPQVPRLHDDRRILTRRPARPAVWTIGLNTAPRPESPRSGVPHRHRGRQPRDLGES